MRRPTQLAYWVDEIPPRATTILLGVQHLAMMSVGFLFAIVTMMNFATTPEQQKSVVQMSMIACGIGTILQTWRKGPIGSGYLCPISCGPAYIPASIMAGMHGGLPLIFGMTTCVSVFEAATAQVLHKLRSVFPPEVTGLVVTMVGVEIIPLGCERFLAEGIHPREPSIAVAALTLGSMVAVSIWGKGQWRLYPLFIGLGVGCTAAWLLGVLTPEQIGEIGAAPFFGLPHRAVPGWAFDASLIVPFIIAMLSSSLKTVGDLTVCQRVNDAEWVRPDMRNIGGGVLATAFASLSTGLLGGMGMSTFSSCVGLSVATGATSRIIGVYCGSFAIALAFFPKITAALINIPRPVVGAIIVYVAAFMIVSGIGVITSRMMDQRKTFVVGIPFIFGLSVDMVPGAWKMVPMWLKPLVGSGISVATILTISLNMLLRLGSTRSATADVDVDEAGESAISVFFEDNGRAWGARQEVVSQAAAAVQSFHRLYRMVGPPHPLKLQLSFDEFNLRVDLQYRGPSIGLEEGSTETAGGVFGYHVTRHAKSVETVSLEEDRLNSLRLQFEH